MKKVFNLFAALCMMMVAMLSFTSCDKDEEKNDVAPSVEGTWVGKIETGFVDDKITEAECTITFSKDKVVINTEGQSTEEYTYTSSPASPISETPKLTFFKDGKEIGMLHYKVEGNKLTFLLGDGTWAWRFQDVTFTKK